MKIDLIKQFNLPNYVKGKTFAQASKLIENKFKDRDDQTSLKTKKSLLERLAQAQEFINSSSGNNKFSNGGEMTKKYENGGLTPKLGTNDYLGMANTLFQFGNKAFGDSGIDTSGNNSVNPEDINVAGGTISSALKGASAGASLGPLGALGGAAIGTLSGLIGGNKVKKDALEASKNFDYKQNNKYNNDFKFGGPVNKNCGNPGQPPCPQEELNNQDINNINSTTGIEMDPELVRSLFYKQGDIPENNSSFDFGKYKKVGYFNVDKQNNNEFNISNTSKNPHNRDTMKGLISYLKEKNPNSSINFTFKNQFAEGGPIEPINNVPKISSKDLLNFNFTPSMLKSNINPPKVTSNDLIDFNFTPAKLPDVKKNIDFNAKDYLNNNNKKSSKIDIANLLRYAPTLTNAAQLGKLKKTKYEKLDKLDNRYKPNFIDETSLQNTIENQYGNLKDKLAATSRGSLGALRSNLLGASLNKTKALSNANISTQRLNNLEKSRGQEFNANIDKLNISQSNLENDINAKNLGNYNTQKSKLISQLGNDIGNIGLEEMRKKYPEKMGFLYNSKGEYIGRVDENGKFIDKKKEVKNG